jgi:dUTP pyrophosphatase
MITVDVVTVSNAVLPNYETPHSAGCDVRANLKYDAEIPPGGSMLIPTGLSVRIPAGYEIQVRPRSGMALKYGVTVLNTPGTIDADYRGEIGVILINHGKDYFVVKHGDRIAQLVLNRVETIDWNQVSALDGTKRGQKGFGSTGER